MSRPIIKEHNVTTGEVVEREMTDEEYKLYQSETQRELERVRESQEKAEKKAELLDRLGITEEEANLLLS